MFLYLGFLVKFFEELGVSWSWGVCWFVIGYYYLWLVVCGVGEWEG